MTFTEKQEYNHKIMEERTKLENEVIKKTSEGKYEEIQELLKEIDKLQFIDYQE